MKNLLGTNLKIEGNLAFNLDTILLADFSTIPKGCKTILDFGCGSGALMLYLSQKCTSIIKGIEIQKNRVLLSNTNIQINNLENRLSVELNNIKDVVYKDIDYIICNPPFFKVDEKSNLSIDEDELIARHEVTITLEDIIKSISRCLKFGGQFSMIHRPDRFMDIIELLNKYDLSLKKIRFVYPFINREANHVLLSGIKNGKSGVSILPPLIVYDKVNINSSEMIDIYNGRTYKNE
jgi:tRNA1(Val) A37 N6-methylase TrmN6